MLQSFVFPLLLVEVGYLVVFLCDIYEENAEDGKIFSDTVDKDG